MRRRWPIEVFWLVLAGSAGVDLLTGNLNPAGLVVALYTIAAHAERPSALRAVTGAAAVAAFLIVHDRAYNFGVVVVLALLAVAWAVGDNMRTKRAYLRALEERAVRLEREREQHALRAAAEEQARIARELHDVIAHSVSVMVVQAAAGEDVFDSHPERSRQALQAIEATGRSALTELRRLLGVVRTPAETEATRPSRASTRWTRWSSRCARPGCRSGSWSRAPATPCPSGSTSRPTASSRRRSRTRSSTPRRPAPTSSCATAGSELVVEVVDDGQAAAVPGDGGHGLIGMRERVALYGGELDAGRRDKGGFGVRARFPLDAEPSR